MEPTPLNEGWFVYALYESDTGAVRYIGQTKCPHSRLAQHRGLAAPKNIQAWIRELGTRSATSRMLLLHECSSEAEAIQLEAKEIENRKLLGCSLVNYEFKPRRRIQPSSDPKAKMRAVMYKSANKW